MASLRDILLQDGVRPTVVREIAALLDDEVARKTGVGGMAIKAAFKTVKTIKVSFLPAVVDALLEEWLDAMEPEYQDFLRQGGGDFQSFSRGREAEMAEALLSVTDRRAEVSVHRSAASLYKKLRPSASAHVASAVPALTGIVARQLV